MFSPIDEAHKRLNAVDRRTRRNILWLGLFAWLLALAALFCFWHLAAAQDIPPAVLAYERVKSLMPAVKINGAPLQGLSLCKLKARCNSGEPQPFLAMPADMLDTTQTEYCDLSKLILAYGGWCRAGIEHPSNPHLAPSMLPLVSCAQHGEITVMYWNNITKLHWKPTPEGQAKAVEWLSHPTYDLKPWSPHVELIPQQWLEHLPPKPTAR